LRFIHKKLTRERKGSKGKAGRRERWKKGTLEEGNAGRRERWKKGTQRRKDARAQGKTKTKGKGKGKKGDKKTNQNRA
jgi:hypothetical protein